MWGILTLGLVVTLNIKPSDDALDYSRNQGEFQLHTLVTEQRHPKTLKLGQTAKQNAAAALDMLFSVDDDVAAKMKELADAPGDLTTAVDAVAKALGSGHKIYFFGCGATGRLAVQMESGFWRPFWRTLPKKYPELEGALIGDITGGDRALVSSLPTFEDIPAVGKAQLDERGIKKGDVVFAVTEGGETSSVIGAITAAAEAYGASEADDAKAHLFFVYNNPDEPLKSFERSRVVIENPAITKLRLFTGPQALAGSTRMQATTSEMFVLGMVVETAVARVLEKKMTPEERKDAGFGATRTLADRLRDFAPLHAAVTGQAKALAKVTEREAATYAAGKHATYYAERPLVTVFTDSTERAPTFRLLPLDPTDSAEKKSWIRVWSAAGDPAAAWRDLLGREFHGLPRDRFEPALRKAIPNLKMQVAAVESLKGAGDDQRARFDFSFGKTPVEKGDLGVAVLEAREKFPTRFSDLMIKGGANVAALGFGEKPREAPAQVAWVGISPVAVEDPFGVRENVALKMLLNAHSTAVMARLGRVVGNTMTNVNPANKKLIGRATKLIQNHVNDVVDMKQSISYEQANIVLYDAMDWVKSSGQEGAVSEVALSIVRVVELLKKNHKVTWPQAKKILDKKPLGDYLAKL